MFQTSVLVSGSKGNSVLVRTGEVAVLLDAGVAGKTIFTALESLRVNPAEIKGILVSHEHSDHIRGVGVIARALNIPVYINRDTHQQCSSRLGKLPRPCVHFETGSTFTIGDLVIHPFSSPHDAADSCNFTFARAEEGERKLGVATDLGFPNKPSLIHLRDCTTLVLESNHDKPMLMNGPYDWHLKQRISSDYGHLSNEQAVGLVSQLMHHRLSNLVLAHLSEINNDPNIAQLTMRSYLDTIRSDVKLYIADQHSHTPLLNV